MNDQHSNELTPPFFTRVGVPVFTVSILFFVAGVALWYSFGGQREAAEALQVAPRFSWVIPIVTDAGIVLFGAFRIVATLMGKPGESLGRVVRSWYRVLIGIAVTMNLAHTPWFDRLMTAESSWAELMSELGIIQMIFQVLVQVLPVIVFSAAMYTTEHWLEVSQASNSVYAKLNALVQSLRDQVATFEEERVTNEQEIENAKAETSKVQGELAALNATLDEKSAETESLKLELTESIALHEQTVASCKESQEEAYRLALVLAEYDDAIRSWNRLGDSGRQFLNSVLREESQTLTDFAAEFGHGSARVSHAKAVLLHEAGANDDKEKIW